MGTYDRPIATVLRLIREKGKAMQLERVTTTGEVARPWKQESKTTELENVDVVILPFTQKDAESQGYVMGSEVHKAVEKALVAGAATATPPNLQDVIVDGAVRWTIDYIKQLAPNGEQILYTMRLCR